MLSSTAVFSVNAAISFSRLFLESFGLKPIMGIARDGAAQRTAFTDTPTIYYLRRERTDRHHIANIFDASGVKIYTIERRTVFTPVWSMLTVKERREVATLHAGLVNRYFDFNHKLDLSHRDIAWSFGPAGMTRQFHLNDGAAYEWRQGSRFLERVVNPGSGEEEIRQRVAKARQLRTMRFDFEILVDETMIDRDIVLVTAYIAMMTQWGIGSYVDTRGPTLLTRTLRYDEPHQRQEEGSDQSRVEFEMPTHFVELIYKEDPSDDPELTWAEVEEQPQQQDQTSLRIKNLQYVDGTNVTNVLPNELLCALEKGSDCNGDVN
ncbi:hypothetical protein D0Z00_002932 [Geotrichum galactomycetum]|uniref:Uncharacterized protein n=1 Tax=Geotrichum galactomycetum TaxID=27317 RepID=A0ACB6V2P5_9ASCO|nr:hypothetical protein D0Z00_002932 [Geotrichum candidum]